MHMLPNEARDEYFVGERFIHELALRSSQRLKFAARTHGGKSGRPQQPRPRRVGGWGPW
jgi:hypothetical protein